MCLSVELYVLILPRWSVRIYCICLEKSSVLYRATSISASMSQRRESTSSTIYDFKQNRRPLFSSMSMFNVQNGVHILDMLFTTLFFDPSWSTVHHCHMHSSSIRPLRNCLIPFKNYKMKLSHGYLTAMSIRLKY